MSGRSASYSRQRIAEDFEEEFTRALSLTTEQERKKRQIVFKENEELQLALALSKAIHDESLGEGELEQARILNMRLQLQKEQSEIELAMALSVSELDRQDQLAGSERERERREEVPLGRGHDGLLLGHFPWNWENEQVDMIQFSDDESETEDELPEVYKDYRRVPTMFSESDMWSRSAVDRQWAELRATCGYRRDPVREWAEGQCESERCLVCLSNVATRMALPCAHRLCCGPCESELVDKHLYYSVTSPSGEISTTELRLPIQCFMCRAIIGQIVSVH